jgi:hypothetical protein
MVTANDERAGAELVQAGEGGERDDVGGERERGHEEGDNATAARSMAEKREKTEAM